MAQLKFSKVTAGWGRERAPHALCIQPEWWRAALSDMLSLTCERYKCSAPLKNKYTIHIAQVLYRKYAKPAEKSNSECIEGQLMW